MITINLHELHDPYFGLIVPYKTGVTYINQTHGFLCNKSQIEGYFVPLCLEAPDCIDCYRLDYNAKTVSDWLTQHNLDEMFEPLAEDEFELAIGVNDKKPTIADAWVWVKVRNTDTHNFTTLLKPLIGKAVILTYENLD
ncbi:MAG: hypothetical protein EOP06_00435 [Proteobacteria bacterium]|nr:MAG: hypothetical protein EOP06_00435 [Pseudomonadota bacterium]